jgi:hypothetical protein
MPDEETRSDNVDASCTLLQAPATPTSLISFGPHRKLSGGDQIYSIKEEYEMVQDRKFVCTLSLLLSVFQTRCKLKLSVFQTGCTAVPTVKYQFVGMALMVTPNCSSGHENKFCSSSKVNNIFVNNHQSAASIILSGSHYPKMNRLAKFLNLEFLSKSSYYRFQRLYLIPEDSGFS